MVKLMFFGKTFLIKEGLKERGFRWNPENKCWSKVFEDRDLEYAQTLLEAWTDGKIFGKVEQFEGKTASASEKKYFVKGDWIFNLESMQDKLAVIEIDARDGKIQFPINIAGKQIESCDDLNDLKEESSNLEWIAKTGKVTGRQYGRIKEIVSWRIEARYATCLASGMSEADAGKCFEEM